MKLYCDGIKMNKPKMRKAKLIKITTSGTVLKAPERVKTATGKSYGHNDYSG